MTNDVRDLKAFPAPFSTAELPDDVVNQRVSITVAVGNRKGDEAHRTGRSALSLYMDDQPSSGDAGGSIGPWPELSFRGQSVTGFRLTEDERHYAAACLYAAALNLIEHRNEGAGDA